MQRHGASVSRRATNWCWPVGAPVTEKPIELDQPIRLTVSGLSIGPLDVEPPGTGISVEPTYVDAGVFDQLVAAGAESSLSSVVWLADGSTEATTRSIDGFDVLIDVDERATGIDRALDTDARALWIMAVAGLVIGLLVLAPVIHRSISADASDSAALAGLGASRFQRAVHVAARIVAVCTVGLLLAVLLTPGILPRLPLGLGAAIISDRRAGWDPGASAASLAVLSIALLVVIAASTWHSLRPHLVRASPATVESRRPPTSLHLGPAGQTGLSAAIGRPAGRRLATPWPGIVSLALAVAVSVAGFTYVAGLRHFESTPRLTGWNWDMIVDIEGNPAERSAVFERIAALDGVEAATAGTGYPPALLTIPDADFQIWPWSFATGIDAIAPTMVAGRAPQGPDEIAIDAVFTEFTGKSIGDTVELSRPTLSAELAEQLGHDDIGVDVPEEAPITSTFEITGLAVFPNDRTNRFPQTSFTLDGLEEFVTPSGERGHQRPQRAAVRPARRVARGDRVPPRRLQPR